MADDIHDDEHDGNGKTAVRADGGPEMFGSVFKEAMMESEPIIPEAVRGVPGRDAPGAEEHQRSSSQRPSMSALPA